MIIIHLAFGRIPYHIISYHVHSFSQSFILDSSVSPDKVLVLLIPDALLFLLGHGDEFAFVIPLQRRKLLSHRAYPT